MLPPSELPVDVAVLKRASERLGLRMVVLFGSQATREPVPKAGSDVDIAVSRGTANAKASFFDVYEQLAPAFANRSLDLVFLSEADPLFRWEIMRVGALLWGDPMDFLDFRAFAFRDFVDSADLRALERTLFDKRMAYIRRRLNAAA